MKVLQAIVDFLANGTVRRVIVTLLGLATAALNKKLGLNLDPEQLVSIVAMVLGYVAQSAVKEAVVAHADAKTAIADAIAAKAPVSDPK